MCGLVGVICKRPNGFTQKHQEIFSTLLFVDTLRGRDSTGTFLVTNEGDVVGCKEAHMAPYFMQSKEYEQVQQRAWRHGSALIGHNRAATRGKVTDENAHPFTVDNNIVLVHNGTMRSDHKKHADVEVDSHAIAHLIQHKETVAEALGAFHGAYALIWYDVKKGELCMVRNDERPLYWMEVEDAWVWSSEVSMMEFAAHRVDTKIVKEPTSLPVDTLQKFELIGKGWKASSEKLDIKKQYASQNDGRMMGGGRGAADPWDYGEMDWDQATSPRDEDRPPFRRASLTVHEFEQELENKRAAAARDAAWRDVTGQSTPRALQHHPRHGGQHSVIQLLPRDPANTAGSMAGPREPLVGVKLVHEKEREMVQRLNKKINHAQYNVVLDHYRPEAHVHCAPFEYLPANGTDGKDGWYLYASPFDDEDVIFRHWFPAKGVTEERMIQLAGCEYVFEFTMGLRQWFPLEMPTQGHLDNDSPGFVIIRSTSAKLISPSHSKIPH